MSVVLSQKVSTFGAMLMVTGCCIGAGMIGLPVLSAAAGFIPSILAIFVAYAFTTGTGLLLLEATLWFDRQVNLMSIAQFALGKFGKYIALVFFLFLFYGIFVAYLDGGGQLFGSLLHVPKAIGTLICALFVSVVLYTGTRGIDGINRLFMIGLFATYGLILALSGLHVELKNLGHFNWKAGLATLPILFICFGYHNLVPSLTHYLQRNANAVRLAIAIGNLIPLVFYALWNFVILGMVEDPLKLSSESAIVTDILQARASSLLPLINAFCFFALCTSFITVALSFLDFLRDGFRKPPHNWVLQALVLIPPLLISLSYPNLFLKALSFAGGFIDMILFGILPVCIVWIGRYVKKANGPYQVRGGKFSLILMFLLSVTFIFLRFV